MGNKLIQRIAKLSKRTLPEIFATKDKESLINFIPEKYIELFTEERFRKEVSKTETQIKDDIYISHPLNRLRIAFWGEYFSARDEERMMEFSRVREGICSLEILETIYLKNPKCLAWMCKPVQIPDEIMHESYAFGMEKMREVLSMNLVEEESKYDREGNLSKVTAKVNTPLANLQMKILEFMDTKLNGPRQAGVNVNINTQKSSSDNSIVDVTPEALDRQMERMKKTDEF